MQTPSCPWMRVVGAFVVGVVVLAPAIGVAQGAAAESAPEQVAARQAASTDTRAMAAIIQRVRTHSPNVLVERHSTTVGGQIVQVWVRARAGAFARTGVYTLTLLTDRHGKVELVRLSENKAHGRQYHFGDNALQETYRFALDGSPNHQWGLELNYVAHGHYHSFDWSTGRRNGRPPEPRLTLTDLAVLWKQASAVLKKAVDRAPVSEEEVLHPDLICNPSTELTEGCKAQQPAAASRAHAASREVAKLAEHDAAYLAGRIRAAAGRRGPMTIVKVLHGCCGVVALEVYERSRPGRMARFGVYGLTVVTSPHMIDQVKVFEDKTHRPYHLGEAIASQLYNFEISPGGNAHLNEGNWVVGVSHPFHADDHWTTGKVMLHEETAELTAAELQVLYGQALAVLNKAEGHAPVTTEAYLAPGLPCGLPEHQACEPGGRW